MRYFYILFCFGLFAKSACAHSFDERYDLPIPIEFFLVGSGLVVAASFLLIVVASYYWPECKTPPTERKLRFSFRLPAIARSIMGCAGVIVFILVLAAGFFGPGNPLLNLAPNVVWITWWLGFSLAISLFGNIWPLFNPWATLWGLVQKLFNGLGIRSEPEKPLFPFPKRVGLYLATLFLLAWSWMEVVYPIAFVPARVATIALLWTLINFLGMALFGKTQWIERGDVFSIYFSMLGQFGIFAYSKDQQKIYLRIPGSGILRGAQVWSEVHGVAGFIIAMLAIVLFDGLHGSSAWTIFSKLIQFIGLSQISASEYILGTLGLLFVWLSFNGLFYLSCWISSLFTATSATQLTNIFSAALIPIAVAYLVAHNFSSLFIQGQNIIFLVSDPLGLGWDLFSTANYRPNVGLIDASTTWYLAVVSIVLGHVIALVLNHLLAMNVVGSTRTAALATIPQTILMILFTMLSLIIIAEPMTTTEISFWQQICSSPDTF